MKINKSFYVVTRAVSFLPLGGWFLCECSSTFGYRIQLNLFWHRVKVRQKDKEEKEAAKIITPSILVVFLILLLHVEISLGIKTNPTTSCCHGDHYLKKKRHTHFQRIHFFFFYSEGSQLISRHCWRERSGCVVSDDNHYPDEDDDDDDE